MFYKPTDEDSPGPVSLSRSLAFIHAFIHSFFLSFSLSLSLCLALCRSLFLSFFVSLCLSIFLSDSECLVLTFSPVPDRPSEYDSLCWIRRHDDLMDAPANGYSFKFERDAEFMIFMGFRSCIRPRQAANLSVRKPREEPKYLPILLWGFFNTTIV